MFNYKVTDAGGNVVYDGPDKAAAFDALFGGGGANIVRYTVSLPPTAVDVTIHTEGF